MPESNVSEVIPIDSETKTVQNCFRDCLYEVPRFQRPYSWGNDQLEEYWNDVIKAESDFFFGSTVTWVSKKRDLFNDTHSIIDGQQRLTTSAIALSVIRDSFYNLAGVDDDHSGKAKAQGDRTQQYLVAQDDDENEYPVIRRPEKMFYEVIQVPGAIPSGAQWNQSAKRIGDARSYFEDKIQHEINDLPTEEAVECLKGIRNNILKARLIQVELTSEEDGFLIFETLNTRGADLKLSDLVKNLLVRDGAKKGADRDAIADRWDRLANEILKNRTGAEVLDRFIWQSWNSRREAVKEPELFKRISQLVKGNPRKHIEFLSELETDARTFTRLDIENSRSENPRQGIRNAFAIPEFVDSINALAIFNISVANSAIMALVRKYETTKILPKSILISAASAIEKFHFQYNALAKGGSTGGTRGRYNRFAVQIESAQSKQEITNAVDDLVDRLRSSAPLPDSIKDDFRQLFYAPKLPLAKAQKNGARKVFIAYVLMKIAQNENAITSNQNIETWTIEHIKPQSSGSGDFHDPIYSIGNLVLLDGNLNSSIGNSNFNEKAREIEKGCPYLDANLAGWVKAEFEDITDEQIRARAVELANISIERTWAI